MFTGKKRKMQTVKRKWHGKDTVKKAVLIIGFVFVLVLAFASAFNYQHVYGVNGVVQYAGNISTGSTTVSQSFANPLAADYVFVIESMAAGGSGSLNAPTDSQHNTYNLIQCVNDESTSEVCFYFATVSAGADSVTSTFSSDTGSIGETILEVVNGVSFGYSVSYFDGSIGAGESFGVCQNVLRIGSTCNTVGFSVGIGYRTVSAIPISFTGSIIQTNSPTNQGVIVLGQGSGQYSSTANLGFGMVADVQFNGGVGDPCDTYACSSSTFSIVITNSYCVSATDCTNETSTTTISYDATSTTTVVTYCSTTDSGGSNCVTKTMGENITQTYVDTSVSLVYLTSTVTVTNTALNAPSGFQLQFWLVSLIFLLGPAFGLMGGYGATVRERGGNPAATIAALMFMLGLNLGALGGIILKVMPFPVLVLTIIPLCLLLYSMR